MKTLDNSSMASDPGKITLSNDKLRVLYPDLFGFIGLLKYVIALLLWRWPPLVHIKEHLFYGDSRAAVVVSVDPLLVAAYTDDMDCVAMLRYPDAFIADYHLSVGTRLLTVNCYCLSEEYDPDLILGPDRISPWTGFRPVIADFLTDDVERLQVRKQEISEDEWRRALEMGMEHRRQRPDAVRDFRPVSSGFWEAFI